MISLSNYGLYTSQTFKNVFKTSTRRGAHSIQWLSLVPFYQPMRNSTPHFDYALIESCTCPEVMTMSPLAFSLLSAMIVPLAKYRVSLLSISCLHQSQCEFSHLYNLKDISSNCKWMYRTSAENIVRISPRSCNPLRKRTCQYNLNKCQAGLDCLLSGLDW